MREIPDDILAGMGALEAAARHQFVIESLETWPGLSGGQRMVALVIASLEYLTDLPPGSIQVARFSGLPAERVEKVFEGVEHPPFYWSEIPNTRTWAFLPSQKLEYGAQ